MANMSPRNAFSATKQTEETPDTKHSKPPTTKSKTNSSKTSMSKTPPKLKQELETENPKLTPITTKKRKNEDLDHEATEKRQRRFRIRPPQSYRDIEYRALSQRFCILDRRRTGTDTNPEETVELAGTTGNIYTVKINRVPSCDCPHATKGNQCKHIIYVMKRTLRAPNDLVYQLALLTNELDLIFSKAPPIPKEKGEADVKELSNEEDPRRKPISDECPICCVDFDPENEQIVWCKAACGNNAHKACFETWAKMKKAQGADVTCPFCRSLWPDDALMSSREWTSAPVGPEGYRNVAENLGLSGDRDYSTYHRFWVRRQLGVWPEDL